MDLLITAATFLASTSGKNECCGCAFPLIIFIIIVISAISSVKKQGGEDGTGTPAGGSLFGGNTGSIIDQIQREVRNAQQVQTTGVSQPAYTNLTVTAKQRQPINWTLVKLNMTKDQIEDCFDMDALSKGVKKKELPKYVRLEKLRGYFTDPQLRDMIDLDFFTQAEAEKTSKSLQTLGVKLKGLSDTSDLAHLKTGSLPALSSVPLLQNIGATRKIQGTEPFSEGFVGESFSEAPVGETAVARPVGETVSEEFNQAAQLDPFFDELSRKLTDEEMSTLKSKLIQAAESSVNVKTDDMVNGIVWSEILSRRKSGKFGPPRMF